MNEENYWDIREPESYRVTAAYATQYTEIASRPCCRVRRVSALIYKNSTAISDDNPTVFILT